MISDINNENFDEKVLNQNGVVVVDFYANWCGPCKRMMPLIEKISLEYDGKVIFGKVNVEESQELQEKFLIRSVPTFLFFKDGDMKKSEAGVRPINKLREDLNSLLGD